MRLEGGNTKIAIVLIVIVLIALVGFAGFLIGTRQRTPSPSPSPLPTLATLPTPSPTPEFSSLLSPTPTPKSTKTPTPKPTPTKTPTPTSTSTPTPAAFQVTSVVAVASVPGGSCPKTVNFSANITTNQGGTVTYKWERSDNAGAPTESLSFASASTQSVSDTWSLGANYSGWERLHILTPNDLTSNQASFTLTCP